MSISPPRLFGGERNLAIAGFAVSGFTVLLLSPHVTGNFGFLPMSYVVTAAGIAFYFAWMGLLLVLWRIDPWLSRTLPRFLSLPKFMPAHSTTAASSVLRRAILLKGFTR
jgi:hypothetical protein